MRAYSFFFLLVLLLITGCDDTVSPSVGEERPFTVFGYLDPTTSTQLLRVIPIAENINQVDLVEVDAQVRTIHQETGDVIVWQQVPALFADSSEGVIYSADFIPEYENTYRLEVESSTGEMATAQTTVPKNVNISLLTTSTLFRPGIFIEGELPNLVQAGILYEAIALQPAISAKEDITVPVLVSYKGEQDRSDGGWEIRANLRDDFENVRQALNSVCLTTPFITVRSALFRAFVGDEAWVPPGGGLDFDPIVLVQPGVFSNIENGLGYFGAGYNVDFSIRLASSTLTQIGYMPTKPCQPGPGLDENSPTCVDLEPCFNEAPTGQF